MKLAHWISIAAGIATVIGVIYSIKRSGGCGCSSAQPNNGTTWP